MTFDWKYCPYHEDLTKKGIGFYIYGDGCAACNALNPPRKPIPEDLLKIITEVDVSKS